ncbi:MAG: hypothetical protein IPM50_13365 [Acidobacteriota bacterium]|nr:MAG: hypothetical protein IPM50_13365 [Acidobacteriota bacterium]
MSVIDRINQHYGLYVSHIAQVGDQELVVFFSEARVDKDKTEEMKFNEGTEHEVALTGLNPIVTDETCQKYRATFKRFLIYQVVEESCIAWDDAEVFDGGLYRTFAKSRFLDHIDSHLIIDWYQEQPDMKYTHYQIAGLDFIIDVAAQEPPLIEEVDQFLVQ